MSQSGNSEFEASGTPTTRAGRATAFTLRLADLSMAERRASLIELVGRTTLDVMSAVLPGLLETVSPEQTFKDMGLDSLAAVELHDRLAAELGVELPIGIAFDYPTPAVLADYLLTEALGLGERRTAEITAAVGSDEPIAIVGMACRYPGGVATPEQLWELITEGRETVTGFPTDRGWDLDRLFDDDPDAGNTTYARVGHFLHDAAEFDAAFFGISPREAVAMDPQQRLILETCWEAVERAGINPQTLHQSRTGVFIGAEPQDYGPRLHQAPPDVEGYLVTGAAPSVVAGRVAYTLGLEGPAVTVDTACSASLVAIHLACQSLRTGESPLVLAGGVTVMSAPGTYTAFSRQRVIAADGRCKAFSADADGTGFSEGVGVLVLERLSDAVAAGHRVLGVIRGSAVNQDGASNGLTAPNGPSQERVIRQALANAGVPGAEVDAVEAHGTGTALGDPIEAHALLATYGRDRDPEQPLWLGSVKSNIGHTQAAAGVAGVIKMVLAMRHGLLPRTLHVSAPTAHVDWEQGQVRLLEQAREWPEPDGRPRRAGVSSFGVSGTNAHVIVEQAPEPQLEAPGDAPVVSGVVPWVLSGRGEEALRAQASRLAEYVDARPEVPVEGVGVSLVRARAAFEDRAVVVGADREELLSGLRALAAGESDPAVVSGTASGRRDAVLVFPGQGAQWAGMGVELAQASPVFAARLEECFAEIRRWVDWDPAQVLADAESLQSIERLQPVAFAVGVALAELWESVGVRPTAVVGHSQGEVAAACVAGVLSLADAVRVVVLRSRLFAAELWGRGAIAAVGLPAEVVRERIASLGAGLEVSADNGPASCAVAGPTQALEELVERLRGEGVRARVIATTVASHSQMVEPLREQLLEMLGPITPGAGRVPVYSTVTGGVLAGSELGAEYWFSNARRPVDFQGAVRALLADGRTAFVEVSPHPVLTMAVQDILDAAASPGVAVGSLRRGEGGPDRFVRSVAEAFTAGVAVDWERLLTAPGTGVELPTYAFQHRRYWLEPATTGVSDAGGLGQSRVDHPLLGAAVELPDQGRMVLTGRISTATHPWLSDHGVGQTVIFPGTGFVELAVRAGDEVGCPVLEELTLEAPLVIEGDEAVQLQVAVSSAGEDGRREVTIHARTGQRSWTRHAAGTLTATSSLPSPADEQWPPAGAQAVDVSSHYETLASTGYGYGPAFQGLKRAWIRDNEVFAEVELDEREAAEAGGYGIHPALLDAALHATGLIEEAEGVALPFAWNGVELLASGAQRVRVHARPTDDGATSIHITDTTGAPVAIIASLISRPLPAGGLSSRPQPGHDALHRVQWVPLPGEPAGSVAGDVAVVGERWPALAAAIQAAGGGVGEFVDVAAVGDAVASGQPLPAAVVLRLPTASGQDRLRPELDRVVGVLGGWLADERLAETRLVLVTSGAVTTGTKTGTETGGALVGAAVSGLVRSAQAENPGRILLVDLDDAAESLTALASLLGVEDEPQLAVRAGRVLVPRLARADTSGDLATPDGPQAWRLDCPAKGSLEELALIPAPEADRELAAGEVRVDVRAAGLNFRDVVVALGMVPEQGEPIGGEFAGVVSEVGPGVEGVRVGDRVMGLGEAAFGPRVVVDQRLLVALPAGWSFAQGAGVTVAFATAWYGLVDLAGLARGERVLIHSGAGGVGMAAIQIARHLGAEVFATASPAKQHLLRALGVPDDHIASSRDLDFADAFAAVMGGAGMDVVLNSLAGPFTDASLDLLAEGGRFIEMGKTDRRDPAQVAETHPQVRYRSFDLMDAGYDRIGQMLAEQLDLFANQELAALPVRCWPVQQARQAFRHMAQARHTGKIILTMPRSLDPDGTVLITGGTGGLGAILARHLATEHQVKHLLLASRRGDQAPDADQLRTDLEAAGATVDIAACDLADSEQVAGLLDQVSAEHPLTAVFHTAGVLDDGVVTSLTPDKIDRVLRPKADAAWHLHHATRHLDLAAFVLYSSSAGTLDSAGQGNYSAANAFLDALAIHRHTTGLPAQALAWGLWHQPSGMSAHLTTTDITRIEQAGYHQITTTQGNQLLDTALTTPQPHLLPLPINTHTLSNRHDGVPAILRGLARTPARRTARTEPVSDGGSALERRLAGLPAAEQEHVLVSLVCAEAAAVLGHASGEAIQAGRPFKDLGFDSLTSVELRNRLSRAAGMKLPATLVFDHPTPTALAAHLLQRVTGNNAASPAAPVRAASTSAGVGEPIAIVAMSCRYPGGVNSPEDLWEMLVQGRSGISSFPEDRGWDLEALYDPDPDHVGTTYLREGGFLKDAAGFDAAFFGISPREAIAIDPQQRLLLETSWEVLERAGIDPDTLRGTPTGVFIGGTHTGYGSDSPSADVEGYLVTGTSSSVMSGRVAYNFGLEGPALTVDTACSSSLVAIHLACESLRRGESALALAGGVTVLPSPELFIQFSRQRGLARDGRCKAFSDEADGTVFSEGVGILLLERLSEAQANGHQVLGVIRGSAVNQDGASNGLSAPNGPSQERVIRQALANAGLAPGDIDAVEAHGTGTKLGDPIEAQALLEVYGARSEEDPLWLGTVKSNLGHTQCASGVAGVIKMVLAAREGLLPQTLHITTPTTHVDWEQGQIRLLQHPQDWPHNADKPRRAAISSFGISGTNAHLILEQAPHPAVVSTDTGTGAGTRAGAGTGAGAGTRAGAEAPPSLPLVPVALSARDQTSLAAQAARLAGHLTTHPDLPLHDIALSTATTRAHLEHRAVILARNTDDLHHALDHLTGTNTADSTGLGTGNGVAKSNGNGNSNGDAGAGDDSDGSGAGATNGTDISTAIATANGNGNGTHDGTGTGTGAHDGTGTTTNGANGSNAATESATAADNGAASANPAGTPTRPDTPNGNSNGNGNGVGRGVNIITGRARPGKTAFLYSGQGAQHPGMGRQLYETFPTFATALNNTLDALDPHLEHPLRDIMWAQPHTPQAHLLNQTTYTQPALFALQTALTHLLASLDIHPHYLAGHSLGEITAAHTAGILTLTDAATLITQRAHLMQTLPQSGAMTAINATPEEITPHLTPHTAIAAINSPTSTVISGNTEDVQHITNHFTNLGRKTRPLTVSHAFHSPLLDPILTPLNTLAHTLTHHPAHTPLITNTTATPTHTLTPTHWAHHARQPVQFANTITHLHHTGVTTYLEIGPDTTLSAIAPHNIPATHTTSHFTPTLRKNHPEPDTLLAAIATTHTHNTTTTPNWHHLLPNATTTDLPTYPFQHHHYWLEPPAHGHGSEGPRDDGFWKALESEETEALATRLKVDADALRTVLPALSSLRDAERKRSVLDDWRYKLVWRGVSAPSAAGITGTAWLVAVPAAGGDPRIVRDVLDGLSARAARVHPLVVGGEDRTALAEAIRAQARPGLTGVLCLLPLDDEPHEEHPTLSRGAAATVTLVQALADAEVSAPLWLTTSGAVALDDRAAENRGAEGRATGDAAARDAAGGEEAARDAAGGGEAGGGGAAEGVSPFQTALWGLGAVLAVDHPDTWGGIVDLPPAPGADDLALLQGVLSGASGEDQVAIRSGVVRARRMVRSPNGGADRAPSWKPSGTVLVTGGTSGVGANVARWLAREGAGHLVLVSRRGRGADGVAELEAELTALGAEVTVAACDVADRAAVRDLLESIPGLTAVMHAAGVGHDDVLVADTTLEDFAGYARSKVIGAINLDELLGDRPLEAFVMFSSGAAVWGSSGQASYAAANAFLDGLAQRRRLRGLAGSSIAWGGWGGGGMMEDAGEQLGRSGLRPMAPDAAAMAIGQLVGSGEGHLVVTDIDWERFAPAFALARPRPLVSAVPEFTRALEAPAATGSDDDGTAFAARLAELPPAKRERLVVSLVRAEAAAVLGHTSDDPVQPDRAFNELGFDSLTAVELRNRLGRATGLKLPATLVFDYPTPIALARFVQDRLAPETPSGSIFAQLDEMERLLREQALSAGDRAQISDRFRAILHAAEGVNGAAEEAGRDLDDLSDEELFAALDDQLGAS